jgi:hypothetical protein
MSKLSATKSIKNCIASCIDIYKEFDNIEIKEQLTPVRAAWVNGRDAYLLASGAEKCIYCEDNLTTKD